MNTISFTANEQRQLLAVVKHPRDPRQYRRALAVLEFISGKTVMQIAQQLHVNRQSVYNWIASFQKGRTVQALADAPRCGRPRRFDRITQAHLLRLLQSTPQQAGYCATQWTVPLLQEQLWHDTGQRYCDRTVRHGLHRLGYVWKRARYVLAADPQREKKTPHLPHRCWLAKAQRGADRG